MPRSSCAWSGHVLMPQCRVAGACEAATCGAQPEGGPAGCSCRQPDPGTRGHTTQEQSAQGTDYLFSAAFHWGKHRPKNLPFWYSTGYLIWQAGYPLHPYFLCQILYVSGSKGSIAGSSCLFSRSLNLNWSTGILLHTSWEGDFHVAYLVFVFNVTKNTVNVNIKLYQALNFFFIQEADKI